MGSNIVYARCPRADENLDFVAGEAFARVVSHPGT
jgi:hypothetical protein